MQPRKKYPAHPFNHHQKNLLASLRGLPTSSRPTSRSRNTLQLNDLIDTLTEKYKIGKTTANDIIIANWQYIVGTENAQRACPSNIDRNTLIVKVSNPIVRNELQFEIKKILKRLQGLPQCQNIKRVNLVSG